MEPHRTDWAEGFLTQARSDWAVFERLLICKGVEPCHALHYLQMACEKLAKAYQLRNTDADAAELMKRHVGFERFVNAWLRSPTIKARYEGRDEQLQQLIKHAKQLAREVEALAPAADRVQRPDNSEYPWADGAKVVAPCLYAFPNLSLLHQPSGRTFLALIKLSLR